MKQHGKKLLALSLALVLVLGATLGISAPIVQAEETAGNVEINEENFPDANFRAYVKTLPGAEDGKFTPEELAGITEISYRGSFIDENEIEDLTGIEHFTALVSLYCFENHLTSLDVSKLTALTELNCSYNQLNALDVSNNAALTKLDCGHNQLTSVDVRQNPALTGLYCFDNQLTALDVSQNTALEVLSCAENLLTSLDLSQNTALTELYCENNQLTRLDLSQNTALTELYCAENLLTSLDVSQNTALTELYCDSNQLTSLDLRQNSALGALDCSDNYLTSLDVSQNKALTWLSCYDNQRSVADGSYLLDLDANFDISKVSNLEGGSFEGGKVHFTADQLTYTYDTAYDTDSPWAVYPKFTMVKNDEAPQHTHRFGDWTVTKEVTCTEDGVETRTCPVCGEVETKTIPATGHKFGDWTVTKAATSKEEGVETRTCSVCGATETRAIPKLQNPFTDMKSTEYYVEPVLWAVNKGITVGTSETAFSPEDTCTRAQIATFLWRNAGKPAPKGGNNPFTDLPSNEYYYNAVLWAVENGITAGTTPTTFGPSEGCTRAQVATFLWRAAGKPAPQNSENPFTDVPSGEYYYNAVLWAVEQGITVGTSKTTFSPEDTCTRAQIVTFLYRSEH